MYRTSLIATEQISDRKKTFMHKHLETKERETHAKK